MKIPFVLNGNNLSVFLKGRPYSINNAHLNFKKIAAGLKSGLGEDELVDLVHADLKKEISDVTGVSFSENGSVLINGEPVSNAINARYRFMVEKGLPLEGFKLFIWNLAQNPSADSRKELYSFLDACVLPITEDGHFLAYKKVNSNYTDCYSGTFDNHVGRVVEMPREKVNANRKETCSAGLHVCSRSYLGHFYGSKVVVCKVNPRDVVSVPVDYNSAKMRVCRYEVISELKDDNDGIKDMSVNTATESVTVLEKGATRAEPPNSKTTSKKESSRADKWEDYIKTRNIPENLGELAGLPKKAFFKFCVRLHNRDGSQKAGEDIRNAKTVSEIRRIILGY
jgi:hypothetical protein